MGGLERGAGSLWLQAASLRASVLSSVPCSLFLLRTLPQRGGEGFLGTGGLVAEGLCVSGTYPAIGG